MTSDQLTIFKTTKGAMSTVEGVALCALAAIAPDGVCVECGSAYGKSAVAAASGLLGFRDFFLIDPHFAGMTGDERTAVRMGVLLASGRYVRPTLLHGTSAAMLPDITGDLAYALLDSGDHGYELVKSECDLLLPRMVPGGLLVFHDLFSQFTGVERAYKEMLASGQFEEVAIPWAAHLDWLRDHDTPEPNSSWHHTELANPMFMGALRKL